MSRPITTAEMAKEIEADIKNKRELLAMRMLGGEAQQQVERRVAVFEALLGRVKRAIKADKAEEEMQ